MLDKVDPPSIPDGYAMSVAFSALLDLVRGITVLIERELAKEATARNTPDTPPAEPHGLTHDPEPGERGEGAESGGVLPHTQSACLIKGG